LCGEAKAAAEAPVGREDAGDVIDGAKVATIEVERGRAPEMVPPGGEVSRAGGKERDDLTQNGIREEANSVDPTFFSIGSRRWILYVGFISSGSRT
jgi:hypothetical protein